MPELSQNGTVEFHDAGDHHHRHRRKRRSRKKLYRKIIIVLISLAVGGGALAAWHFLVQETPARSMALHFHSRG